MKSHLDFFSLFSPNVSQNGDALPNSWQHLFMVLWDPRAKLQSQGSFVFLTIMIIQKFHVY